MGYNNFYGGDFLGYFKKPYQWLLGIGTVVLILVFLFFARSIDFSNNQSMSKKTVELQSNTIQLYFVSQDQSKLVGENVAITKEQEEDIILQVLEALKQGPQTPGLFPSIPKNIEFIDTQFDEEEHMVELNLSSAYFDLKAMDEVFFRASVVKTLTELPFVQKIQFFVEEKPLLGTDGKPLGPISAEDIILEKVNPLNTEYKEIQLYFSNQDATALVVENRTIAINPNEPLEKYVMEQLIAGPQIQNLHKTIPPETKIKGIQTSDGICYVDLSTEFRTKHWGGSTGEIFTIYSIVNSLTELPHIQKVQFLIEGEKQETFKGHVDFSNPFERNLDFIQQ